MAALNETEIEMHLPFVGKDRNGNTYSKECMDAAVKKFTESGKTLPLIFNMGGTRVIIGEVTALASDSVSLVVKATLNNSGTLETCTLEEAGVVSNDLDFKGIAIVADNPAKFSDSKTFSSSLSREDWDRPICFVPEENVAYPLCKDDNHEGCDKCNLAKDFDNESEDK